MEADRKARDVVAVDNITLEVPAGTVLGLVGPNGSGKTTLLRMLSGILPTGPGSVEIAGFDLDSQAVEAKRCLAYVPDDPKLLEGLTVWEHIRFTGAMYQVENYEEWALELLQRFDLSEKKQPSVPSFLVACDTSWDSVALYSTSRNYSYWMNPWPAWTRRPFAN